MFKSLVSTTLIFTSNNHQFLNMKITAIWEISKLGDLFHSPVSSHLQLQTAPRRSGEDKLNSDLIHAGAGGRGDGLLSSPPPELFTQDNRLFVAYLDLLPVHHLAWGGLEKGRNLKTHKGPLPPLKGRIRKDK